MPGIRFPGTTMSNGWLAEGGLSGGWGPAVGVDTFLQVNGEEGSRVYMAPARYSNVRKVVFSVTFGHIQNGGTLATTFRARIGPSSTSVATRILDSISVVPASFQVTSGIGNVWSNAGPTSEPGFYPLNGSESQVAPRQVDDPRTTTDSQTLTVEYDRTDPESAAFFADWDALVALGDDEYIAYSAGIERIDGGIFTTVMADADRVPRMTGIQMAVIQAPGVTNDSCTYIPGSNGLYPDETMNGATSSILKRTPWFFRADDWDNIESVHVVCRQVARIGGLATGFFKLRVFFIVHQSTSAGPIYEEDFGAAGLTSATVLTRSADIKDLLVDGQIYSLTWSTLTGSSSQDLPWGYFEVVQKSFTKKTTFHPAGMGNPARSNTFVPNPPSSIGDFRYSSDQAPFDPAWYDSMPAEFFTEQRWYGGLDHIAAADTDEKLVTNFDFAGDVPASGSNQQSDEVSSTPDADTGSRVRSFTITRVNPLNLGAPVVMKMQFNRDDWTSPATDDTPGGCGFSYTYAPGNNEFPVLGPLFEVGEFNPEGCTSTAAGLGDKPGVLVMTNGSSIPKKFNPVEGVIENAGIDTPFRDEEPTAFLASVALSPDGGLTPAVYQYRYTFRNCCTGKEGDPNPVAIVVDALATSPAAEVTLNFSGVVIPSDPQICEICIYRTLGFLTVTEAEAAFPVLAKVGCFDPNETSVFVDILSDSELDFFNDGLSTFNAPMPCTTVIAEFRNRLWAMGDIPDLNPPGTVSVTAGSDLILGNSDTNFDRCVLDKFIQIEGDCTAYEIIELLAPASGSPLAGATIKIERDYEGTTDVDLNYILCGHPNRVYISEPLEPECFPLINFLDVDPGDGDRLIGAVSNFNRLVICKRRKTYVISFREQPITEIVVPTLISSDIGCIGPRTFAQVASGSVWLSDRGLALYDGRGVGAIPESSVMNDLFVNPENPNYLRRDSNGRAIGAAAVFYPKREQYLLLLPTVKTTRGASMMLVWDTELRNITLLEFCQEFLSIEVAKDSEGNERVYLGDTNGFVWIWDVGDTDGVGFPNATGTVRGTVTEAGIDSLTGASFLSDSLASFIVGGVPGLGDLSGLAGTSGLTGQSNMGLAGACVFWRPAAATPDVPWQSRFIYTSTRTRLYVTPSWGPDTPSVGDDYMVGPIRFAAEFKSANYGTDDFTKRDWRQVIVHEQETVSTTLRTELLRDFQNSDVDEDTVVDAAGVAGLGRNFDLGFGQGRQVRPVGRLVHSFMGVRLSNFAPDEPLTILNHLLMLIPRRSK